jgi:predicted ATPase/transcriptional regulator with XRE-family HTH domain/Tfp pilus assembly protein PilF
MTTKETILPNGKVEFHIFFSEWIKRRRHELDLTQEQLAKRACCSVYAIRKIEMGERRPSRQLAGLLAQALEIPVEDQSTFIKVARGELNLERLAVPVQTPATQAVSTGPPGSMSGSLPRALTPFIGREHELAALGHLLGDPECRLLTIDGPGGIGKTRLAVEAAHHARDLFPDGAWFIPLVSLNSPALIVPAIAEALNFKFSNPVNPQSQLIRYLHPKKALLVIDNAEHLLDGVGVFAEILENCPHVKLLVTSRERLNLLSEWVFEIQGLPVPACDQVEKIEDFSSVALFLQSARRVRAGFAIRDVDRKWVLRICRAMDGMPLGIELSAAWVGLLSVEEIAREIGHSLDFLSVSLRDLPERHRSLRATLDHSWKLLKEEERLVLIRLSVFRGSFSLEAAQEICGASLVLLSSLKNKCLLYRTEQGLYHLHEIIRQYAERKLAEDVGENEQVKDRHAAYYVQCLAKWEKALQSSRQLETFDEMAQVIDNLSQGWQHMVTHSQPGADGQFCADLLHSALFSLSLFYEMRCRSLEAIDLFKESVDYLKTVQPVFEGTQYYSLFISVLGHITAYLGLHHIYIDQYGKLREYLKEAIGLLEKSQSRIEKAQVCVMLAASYADQGQVKEAVALLEPSREVFREAGVKWWYALSTSHLASNFINLGKFQESEVLFLEALQLMEPGDFRSGLQLRGTYAFLLYLMGDYDRAEQWLRDDLQLCYRFGNVRLTASTILNLSRIALATQRIELAIEYIENSIKHLSAFGETRDLAVHRIQLGQCYIARSDFQAAREQFQQAIMNGRKVDKIHLVCYGLVNIAKIYLKEGQPEKALEISRLIQRCSLEYKLARDEGDALLADLQAVLPEGRMETDMPISSSASKEQARADVLAYVQEFEIG